MSYELDLTLLQTGFGLVENVVEVVGCTQQTTDALGTLHVQMSEGLPMVCLPLHMCQSSRQLILLLHRSSTHKQSSSVQASVAYETQRHRWISSSVTLQLHQNNLRALSDQLVGPR